MTGQTTSKPTCPSCGAEVPPDAPQGYCMKCLFALGTSEPDSAASDSTTQPLILKPQPTPLRSFGDYELLEEIARGGMGIIYKARQKSLGRIVAVKMLLFGDQSGKEQAQRFRAEAALAASLQHPNIVAIHEVSAHEGQPFFVMDFIEGQSLTKLSAECEVRNTEWLCRAARYVKIVAEAIHYAHERGILHRDLKPSNVLIDPFDQPRVTDFGLAKRLHHDSELTLSGQVLGSPNYMPPEQAAAKRGLVGRRSDVYSLGAILYHLLTGRPPFVGETLTDTLQNVVNKDPVSPRLLNPNVPRDLETLCLKCLEKESARRYQTALALAEDLDRFLKAEPIRARRIGPTARLWRWCRRKPVVASLSAATLVLLLAVAVGSPIAAIHINRERSKAEHLLYVSTMNVAQAAWEQNNVGRLRQLLKDTQNSPDRGFEWYYWQRQTHLAPMTLRGHFEGVISVAFSPDGQRIVTGSSDRTAKVWEIATGREMLTLKGHNAQIFAVAFSSDGQRIITGSEDKTAMVWDAVSGRERLTLKGHTTSVESVAFFPDGRRILTAGPDNTARVWDASTGRELFRVTGTTAALSRDGQRIVTARGNFTKLWDAASGRDQLQFSGHTEEIMCVAFSQDGQRVVTGSRDQTAKVWDAVSGQELLSLKGHSHAIQSAAYSPDGQRIVTGSVDQTAKVWDAVSGRELLTLKGHSGAIESVALSPDGRRIVTASQDKTVKVWDAVGTREMFTFGGHNGQIWGVAFSPDGQRIVAGNLNTTASVWDAATGHEVLTLKGGHTAPIFSVAFSPEGQRIVTGGWDGTAKIWDAATGREMLPLRGHTAPIESVAFSRDGHRVVTSSRDKTAIVWEADSGKELLRLKGHSGWVKEATFSPNGRWIVTGSEDATAKLWETATGREMLTLKGQSAPIQSVAFSPDGQRIVAGADDGTAMVWETDTRRVLLTLKGHSDTIQSVTFSPDGRRILTGSEDGTAKLWETVTGREVLTFKGHSGAVLSVAFSRDGQRIVTGNYDATAKVWEAARAEQVAAWQQEEQAARQTLAAFQRDRIAEHERERIAVASDEGRIKRWLILAPVALGAGQSGAEGLDAEQIESEARLRPVAGETRSTGDSELRWREFTFEDYEDYAIDFNAILGRETTQSVAYAVCYIRSETEQRGLQMLLGSDDQARVYLNGKQVYKSPAARPFAADQDTVPDITLNAGLNVLVFKVVNGMVDWKGSIRFTDVQGNPVKGIKVTLIP